jgi:uroporphyrin-3 C-methyltransferase
MSQEPPAEQDAGAAPPRADYRASGFGGPDFHASSGSGSRQTEADPTRDVGSPRSRSPSAWTLLALVLALAVAAAAGLSSWQLRGRIAALESDAAQRRAALETAAESLRSSTAEAAERSAALAGALDAERDRVRDMSERLDPLPARVDAIERRVEADSGSSDARSEWLRAEAEYYLAVANAELKLGGRFQTAVSALELADDRLRSLADPTLTDVRRLVADELQQLKSVAVPDIEGVALGLGSLAARVDELPVRRAGPVEAERPPPTAAAEPGLARLWLAVKGALGSIVSVERTEQPIARALPADERVLVRRRLALELELARAAAVDARPAAFTSSLESALALLRRDFDRDSAAVGAAVELLTRLREIDIAPPRPDISESLLRLRLAGRKG